MCHHHKIDGSHMQGARLRAVWNHTSILVPWQHILSMLILQLNGVLYIVNVFQKTSKILLKVTRIILWHRNVHCETEWIYIHGKMKGSVSFELAVKLKIRWGFLLCRLESVNLTYTELPVITPHTCARGKAISSVHLSVCQHKIARSGDIGIRVTDKCGRKRWKTVFSLLLNAWQGPRALQIVCFHRPHLLTPPTKSMCCTDCACSSSI